MPPDTDLLPPAADGSPSRARSGVRASNISMYFPGTRALDRVSLDVRPGEIHGLLGGNGSGKSTLIKILSGIYVAEPGGVIEIGGHTSGSDELTPEFARHAGLHVVHQDLGIFPDLTVAENLALGNGFARRGPGLIRWPHVRKRAQELIDQFEIDARPDEPMRSVRQSSRTLVAIARACQDQDAGGAGVLILDEPTASLPAHEVDVLLGKLRGYAWAGQSILYVSHRLDEVLTLTDRVTTLRDGRNVGTFDTADLDEAGLVSLITGSSSASTTPGGPGGPRVGGEQVLPLGEATSRPATPDAPSDGLVVEGLHAGGLRDVSFRVAPGEVVGVAGLLGSGRTTLLQSLFGTRSDVRGSVRLGGDPARLDSVSRAMGAGVAYVPESRLEQAVFLDESVALNLAAGRLRSFRRGPRIRYGDLVDDARRRVADFGIKTANVHATIATLSGGNQQKVVMARWIARAPRLLLLDEPSPGVDVGARAEIWRLVREAASRGTAVLVVTSDFEELASVVDRALVLRDGHIAAELSGEDLTAHNVTRTVYFDPEELER